jgi:DnaJ-like protein
MESARRAECCKILGIAPDAGANEIRQAYLDLVQVWHPDRFQGGRLKRQVQERLQGINRAYADLTADPDPTPPSQPASPGLDQMAISWLRTAGPWRSALLAGGLLTVALVLFTLAYFVAKRGAGASGRVDHQNPQQALSGNAGTAVESTAGPPDQSTARPGVAAPRPAAPSKRSRRVEPQPDNEAPSQPPTGELDRASAPLGAGKLTILNPTALDAFARVVPQSGGSGAVRAIYIRAAESYSISDLPAGRFLVYVDFGSDWLARKRRFAKEQRQSDPIGPFNYVQILSTKGVGSDDYHIALKAPAD